MHVTACLMKMVTIALVRTMDSDLNINGIAQGTHHFGSRVTIWTTAPVPFSCNQKLEGHERNDGPPSLVYHRCARWGRAATGCKYPVLASRETGRRKSIFGGCLGGRARWTRESEGGANIADSCSIPRRAVYLHTYASHPPRRWADEHVSMQQLHAIRPSWHGQRVWSPLISMPLFFRAPFHFFPGPEEPIFSLGSSPPLSFIPPLFSLSLSLSLSSSLSFCGSFSLPIFLNLLCLLHHLVKNPLTPYLGDPDSQSERVSERAKSHSPLAPPNKYSCCRTNARISRWVSKDG
ncbi:hypothetical protein B0T19DRAFT_28283 [Cercophora scortea]|uniref:Secreted protein n=1 Tax=Cercophora scortea TaxID=314031 RepID=A0AAE0J3Y0_9PEZI|nr:hypothetical protein B0T19DRAFT_28283 [Cercophora scortea]